MRARVALPLMFEQAGFTLVRERNHQIWRCPCGHTQVTFPCTPGKGRSTNNNEGLLRRTLRACNPQPTRSAA